ATAFTLKKEDLPPPSQPNFMAVFTEMARLGKTNDVRALAEATGGSDYPFTRERSLENAIERLGVEIHSQYILSFTPPSAERGMHRIEVSVARPAGARIHSRQAYWTE